MVVALTLFACLEPSQSGFPPDILLAGQDVERGHGRVVLATRKRFGLQAGDTVHVLLKQGRSLEPLIREVRTEPLDCGRPARTVIELSLSLPYDSRVVAWTPSDPPATWTDPPWVSTRTRNEARHAIHANEHALRDEQQSCETTTLPFRGGWFARSICGGRRLVGGQTEWRAIDHQWTPEQGAVVLHHEAGPAPARPAALVAVRDLDGDGVAERIFADDCDVEAVDAAGRRLVASAGRCCP